MKELLHSRFFKVLVVIELLVDLLFLFFKGEQNQINIMLVKIIILIAIIFYINGFQYKNRVKQTLEIIVFIFCIYFLYHTRNQIHAVMPIVFTYLAFIIAIALNMLMQSKAKAK